MNHVPFSIKEALLFGFRAFKNNAILLIGVSLLGFSINLGSRMVSTIIIRKTELNKSAVALFTSPLFGKASSAATQQTTPEQDSESVEDITTAPFTTKKIIGFFLLLLVWLLATIFNLLLLMGWNQISLDIYDTGRSSFDRLWAPRAKIGAFFITSCLYAALCGLGLLLLVIPGIIWAIKYSFSDLIIVDTDKRPLGALQSSDAVTSGYKWDLLLLYFIEIIITAVSLITIIGPFILTYVFFLSRVYVYRKLKEYWQQQHQSPTPFMP